MPDEAQDNGGYAASCPFPVNDPPEVLTIEALFPEAGTLYLSDDVEVEALREWALANSSTLALRWVCDWRNLKAENERLREAAWEGFKEATESEFGRRVDELAPQVGILRMRLQEAEARIEALEAVLRYIASPTMGRPGHGDPEQFARHEVTLENARVALGTCIYMARTALDAGYSARGAED